MQTYGICGLSVASEVALPGAYISTTTHAPDVTLRADDVPAALSDPTVTGPNWQIAGTRFLLRIPGIARLLLTAGHDVAFEHEAGADPADIPAFLAGTVLRILLHQRGQIVLHASAIGVNGKAVLFGGRSGTGKSKGKNTYLDFTNGQPLRRPTVSYSPEPSVEQDYLVTRHD